MIIKTKKFILRPYREGDEKTLARNLNDSDVSRFMSIMNYPYKIKDANQWINHCMKMYEVKNKKEIVLAIDINKEVIGAVGLHDISKDHKAEIGYWITKKYQGRGIASKAVKEVTNFGFHTFKLKRITAHIFSENKASVRVVEKSGYKFEGVLKKYIRKNGKYYDALLYAKVK